MPNAANGEKGEPTVSSGVQELAPYVQMEHPRANHTLSHSGSGNVSGRGMETGPPSLPPSPAPPAAMLCARPAAPRAAEWPAPPLSAF